MAELSRTAKFYFVYQTKNMINGKTYIGVRTTNDINDGYIGCGVKSQAYALGAKRYGLKSNFINAVCKHGYDNFKREILCFFDSAKEAYEEEEFLVNEDWVKSKDNYNLALGGSKPKSTRITSDEQENQIYKMYMEGVTMKEIGYFFGFSSTVVRRVLKSFDTN